MKAILIRVAILLFIQWLKKNKGKFEGTNNLLDRILSTSSYQGLIDAFEHTQTEKSINDIVTDIENETISNAISSIIKK